MSSKFQKRIMREIRILQDNQNGNNDINFNYTVDINEEDMSKFTMNVQLGTYDKDKKQENN